MSYSIYILIWHLRFLRKHGRQQYQCHGESCDLKWSHRRRSTPSVIVSNCKARFEDLSTFLSDNFMSQSHLVSPTYSMITRFINNRIIHRTTFVWSLIHVLSFQVLHTLAGLSSLRRRNNASSCNCSRQPSGKSYDKIRPIFLSSPIEK